MHGIEMPVQTRYGAEVTVMQEMHWSYESLLAAPADMVDEILEIVRAKRKWERERQKRDEAMAKSRKQK